MKLEKRVAIARMVLDQSYLELDCELDSHEPLLFCTREHGNVQDEYPSQKDANEALRIGKIVGKEFNLKFEIEPVDEWIHLTFTPM